MCQPHPHYSGSPSGWPHLPCASREPSHPCVLGWESTVHQSHPPAARLGQLPLGALVPRCPRAPGQLRPHTATARWHRASASWVSPHLGPQLTSHQPSEWLGSNSAPVPQVHWGNAGHAPCPQSMHRQGSQGTRPPHPAHLQAGSKGSSCPPGHSPPMLRPTDTPARSWVPARLGDG